MDKKYKDMSFFERVLQLKLNFMGKGRVLKGTGKGISSRNNEEFDFIQLSDFLSEALELCEDLGMLPAFTFDNASGDAILTVSDISPNASKPAEFCETRIPFMRYTRSDYSIASIQILGSQSTYLRRYLWMQLLDLAPHDAIDEGNLQPDGSIKKPSAENVNQVAEQKETKTAAPAKQETAAENKAPAEKDQLADEKLENNKKLLETIPSLDRKTLLMRLGQFKCSTEHIEQTTGKKIDEISDDDLRRALKGRVENRIAELEGKTTEK